MYGKTQKHALKSWYCDCDCGTKDHIVTNANLYRTKSCGCGLPYIGDSIIGKRFGRLVVQYKCDYIRRNLSVYHCICDCGNECDVCGTDLTHGNVSSCGCLRKESQKTRSCKFNEYEQHGDYYIGYTLNGKKFYFDSDDYEKVKDYCWSITKDGYVAAKAKDGTDRHIFLHQIILGKYVDHIGGKDTRNDNRKSNLRKNNDIYSFESINNMNKPLQKNNKSGHKGVSWHKRDNIWEVHITVNKRQIYLGRFENFDDAVRVREEAEEKYFGEYSYKNSMKTAMDNRLQEVI